MLVLLSVFGLKSRLIIRNTYMERFIFLRTVVSRFGKNLSSLLISHWIVTMISFKGGPTSEYNILWGLFTNTRSNRDELRSVTYVGSVISWWKLNCASKLSVSSYKRKVFMFDRGNFESYRQQLSLVDWDSLLVSDDINISTSNITRALDELRSVNYQFL
jgi:hypothetical protein